MIHSEHVHMHVHLPCAFVGPESFTVLDYLMHRRTRIEDTAGPREPLIHSVMMAEIGVPVWLGLLCEVSPGMLGMQGTRLREQTSKDDPAEVAREGFEALMAGQDHVVAGSMKNKAQVAAGRVLPETAKAATQARQTEPGSGQPH